VGEACRRPSFGEWPDDDDDDDDAMKWEKPHIMAQYAVAGHYSVLQLALPGAIVYRNTRESGRAEPSRGRRGDVRPNVCVPSRYDGHEVAYTNGELLRHRQHPSRTGKLKGVIGNDPETCTPTKECVGYL